MKRYITSDNYTLLFALFQAYSLQVTIDEIEVQNGFTGRFKQQTNRFSKFLRQEIFSLLNRMYGLDSKEFDVMDQAITENAKQFGKASFEDFFIIKD